jgi:hypothetical protein
MILTTAARTPTGAARNFRFANMGLLNRADPDPRGGLPRSMIGPWERRSNRKG